MAAKVSLRVKPFQVEVKDCTGVEVKQENMLSKKQAKKIQRLCQRGASGEFIITRKQDETKN